MLNETLFQSKQVLSMRLSGKLLKFCFDTTSLTQFPVLATPVPETPPTSSNPMINPAFNPNTAAMIYGHPMMAPPMVNPMAQGLLPDPQAVMAYNAQMTENNEAIYGYNNPAYNPNAAMYSNQMAPVPGMYNQPPGMYNAPMYNNQMMYNPTMMNPAMGVEMTAPVASPVPPIFVPVPVPSAPLAVGTDVTGPH